MNAEMLKALLARMTLPPRFKAQVVDEPGNLGVMCELVSDRLGGASWFHMITMGSARWRYTTPDSPDTERTWVGLIKESIHELIGREIDDAFTVDGRRIDDHRYRRGARCPDHAECAITAVHRTWPRSMTAPIYSYRCVRDDALREAQQEATKSA